MSDQNKFAFVNGELKQVDAPALPVNNRGLMYGDGCFETLCSYQGRFFKLPDHLQRLKAGLDYLNIDSPVELELDKVQPLLQQLLRKNSLTQTDAIIRIQVWRTGSRGYSTPSTGSGFAITASERTQSKQTYQLATVPTRRIPSAALPATFKFTNGLNYIIAARQAHNKGADDALLQTTNGAVSETTVANIFWLKNEKILTPSIKCDVLPGITRSEVIRCLTEHMNIAVEPGVYDLNQLMEAHVVWICNSVKEIAPVTQIDDTYFETSTPFFKELKTTFQSHIRESLDEGT